MRYLRKKRSFSERGATLLIMAAAMIFLLGMCALAIDLVAAYLARVQCQRAADAAALAGAKEFVYQACTSTGGCFAGGPQEALATAQAVAVASQNPVMGVAPTASTVGEQFSYPNPEEPQITVTIYRDATHGDPMPTIFAKIFGVNSMNVSASATAEAYNPSGGATPSGTSGVKPFLVPNCDPNHPVPYGNAEANHNCPCSNGGVSNGDCPAGTLASYDMSYYVDPTSGNIVNPGVCVWDSSTGSCTPTSGVIGAPWVLHDNAAPSQWYTIAFTTQSGETYKTYITESAPQTIACSASLNTLNGKKLGPTDQGIDDLIHANADGLNEGQDYLCSPTWPDPSGSYCTWGAGQPMFPITGGSNNPYGLAGQTFYGGPSDSIANVVLYDGSPLSPGGSSVTVQGYMTIFIQDVLHSGTDDSINSVVMQLGGCNGTMGSATTAPVTAAGGSFIPIRLIRSS